MDAQDLITGFLDNGMLAIRVLGFLLPLISVLGIAGEFTRGQGRLGTVGFRGAAVWISVLTLVFVVIYCLLCMVAVANYDHNYGFVMITFFLAMLPASIFAIIDIVLHRRKGKSQGSGPAF
ncbi:hypothetical protein CAL29_22205 [Bordetella genomosp. 10]|uniref:Uncharacterized protein n=1 Tax=Bordetella genomosp. 10 TaxID=1416804 RepID=A0A261S037_9BORD|nr:hypothetical protein [Bordetella genomosp. 10]OZI30709.1 hypothetical protein CAL29_22205 [Bordetella genomosp. 10]